MLGYQGRYRGSTMQATAEYQQKKKQQREQLDYPYSSRTPLRSQPDQISLTEVAPDLFWLKMPMPMALDHINIYLLKDHDGWYIVDTGLKSEESQKVWQAIDRQVFDTLPVKGLICTHFHYDHASLARWLMSHFSIPLYMTQAEYLMTRAMAGNRSEIGSDRQHAFYQQCGMPQPLIQEMLNACKNDPFIDHYPPDYIRIKNGDTFRIGKRNWQVLTGAGHSPEHACLYCADDALLIAGDQLLPEISSNILVSDMEPEANPLQEWFRSLDKLSGLPEHTLVLPSHGPVFRQLHARIDQLRTHHKEQLQQLLLLAEQEPGFSAYRALQILFQRPLGPVDSMLAQGETLAHLNWLRLNGDLQLQTMSNNPVNQYQPCHAVETP